MTFTSSCLQEGSCLFYVILFVGVGPTYTLYCIVYFIYHSLTLLSIFQYSVLGFFSVFVLCVLSNVACVSGLCILECALFSNVYLYRSCSCCCHFYDQTILSFYVESTGMGVWCCRANTHIYNSNNVRVLCHCLSPSLW